MTIVKNDRGYWEVRVKGPDGKIKSRSTGQRVKEAALRFIRDARIKEIETACKIGVLSQEVASILLTGNNPMTVEKAVPEWAAHMGYRSLSPRTIYNMAIWVKAWAKDTGNTKRPLGALKVGDFNDWINGDSTRKLATRKVMLSALTSFCSFCQDSGWMQGNPANLLQIDMGKLRHEQKEIVKRPCFTEEEVQKMIEGTAPGGLCQDLFWHAAIVIGRYTGLRLGDICSLEWASLNLGSGTMEVWTQKRDRRVSLKLEPEVFAETVADLPHEHPVYVFNHQRGLHSSERYRYVLFKGFSDIRRVLGVAHDKTFHCLRTTFISDCDARGIPIGHIARSVGHWSSKTTEGYIRPATETSPSPASSSSTPPSP